MKDTKKITLAAIFIALMFALGYTPVGTIPLFAGASMTTIFIPVAIGIVLLDDFKYSLALGIGFGAVMFMKVIVPYPASGLLDPYFINPLISVLPRILVAVVGYFIYRGLSKIKVNTLKYAVFGAIIPLLNTIFTLSALFIFNSSEVSEIMGLPIISVLGIILLTNALPELVLGTVVTPAVAVTIEKVKNRRNKED